MITLKINYDYYHDYSPVFETDRIGRSETKYNTKNPDPKYTIYEKWTFQYTIIYINVSVLSESKKIHVTWNKNNILWMFLTKNQNLQQTYI